MGRRKVERLLLLPVLAAIGGTVVGVVAHGAGNPPTVPGVGEDMRPVYATAADVAEGKRVAESACGRCHGLNGISSTKFIPNIAGQRPAYVYIELKTYKEGGRGDNAMASAVKLLSNDALTKAAAYYASLDPAQPAPPPAKKVARPDPVEAGKAAAAGCAGCHGETGVSKTPGMPNLAGLDPKYLVAAMTAYKTGQRKNDMMKSLVSGLSDADMGHIALFFALQKPGPAQTPAQGDVAVGKAASGTCGGCHGEQGVSSNPAIPSLAGQESQYFASALGEYKSGARANDQMKAPASSLDEPAIKSLAAYFASLPPQAPKVRKPMSAEELATTRCDRCHGVNGNSTDPRTPALAAQRADYLEKSLEAYRKGTRNSKAMAAMTEVLSESDLEALAAYYARQRPRSIVYVQVPRPEPKQ